MNNKNFVLAGILLGSMVFTSHTFAAYWWGWGWSSVNSSSVSSTSVLTRDVCVDWDYSSNYYDWTCGSKPTDTLNNQEISPLPSFATQSVKKPIKFILKTETKNKLKQKLLEQQKMKKQDIKMPIKYRIVQNKIDTIMGPRDLLSRDERLKKAVTLFEKTELLLEKKSLSPKIETIIAYLQRKVVTMIQNAWNL